jgi:hypothetical protein
MEEITSTVVNGELNTNATTGRNFDLTSYVKAQAKMIATNDRSYSGDRFDFHRRLSNSREYTPEDIAQIIESGTLEQKQKLSRHFFHKDGYYKQIIIHYATLLKYAGLLIPNPSFGKKLSTSHINKRYYGALEYVENMSLSLFLTNCAQIALVDGTYFGLRVDADKNSFSVIDLPTGYALSRFKDVEGNDLIEFDLKYFDTIRDKESKKIALNTYPKVIRKAYDQYSKGKIKNWFLVPSDIGICFPFFDGSPLFLSVIPKTLEYDEAVGIEQERNAEEIRKIIVQKIPHLNDGRLLFEPDEAEEMHRGTVQMMKGNKNVSVLTTYGDVDAIVSKTGAEQHTLITQAEHNIYAQAGVSDQLFSSNGSSTLESSVKNDMSLMMYLAHKFERFVTNAINAKFANGNINFKYVILPVSLHNEQKYIDTAFKMANSGYSFILPAIAQGFTQRDFINLKDLENDVLELGEKMKPLSSAFTQSPDSESEEGGRPVKEQEDKSEETIAKEESLDKTAGGS